MRLDDYHVAEYWIVKQRRANMIADVISFVIVVTLLTTVVVAPFILF